MKTSLKSIAGMCACAVLAFALLAHADQGVENSSDTSGTSSQSGGKGPGNVPGAPLRRVIKAAENRMQDNKDVRNQMLREEQRGLAGERREIRGDLYNNVSEIRNDIRDDRKEFRKSGTATSGPERAAFRAQVKAERDQIKSLRRAAAIELRDNRGKQLQNATILLDSAETRLKTYMTKAGSTSANIAEATTLLGEAHEAIIKAKADIAAFVAWKPATVTNATGTDPEVDITKPRQLFETAKASIFAARDALRKVAVTLGFGGGFAEGKGARTGGFNHASGTGSTSATASTTATTSVQN